MYRLLTDRNKLERYLIDAGYNDILSYSSPQSTPTPTTNEKFLFTNTEGGTDETGATAVVAATAAAATATASASAGAAAMSRSKMSLNTELAEMPETERFVVELKKDSNGLGITIAGYVCEKEELSGIFVKSVSVGSAADLSGKIQVNDRIIEVDNQSLQGFTNHQAVEVLKKSGTVVSLCLERYLRGPKYEQLQQAIAANELKPQTPSGSGTIFPPPGRSQNSSQQSIEGAELTRRPSLTASHGKQNGSYTSASTVKLSDSQGGGLEYDPLSAIGPRKLMITRDSMEIGATETIEPEDDSKHSKNDVQKIDGGGSGAGGGGVTATVTPEKPKYRVELVIQCYTFLSHISSFGFHLGFLFIQINSKIRSNFVGNLMLLTWLNLIIIIRTFSASNCHFFSLLKLKKKKKIAKK